MSSIKVFLTLLEANIVVVVIVVAEVVGVIVDVVVPYDTVYLFMSREISIFFALFHF